MRKGLGPPPTRAKVTKAAIESHGRQLPRNYSGEVDTFRRSIERSNAPGRETHGLNQEQTDPSQVTVETRNRR
jgi:hypothetical protein